LANPDLFARTFHYFIRRDPMNPNEIRDAAELVAQALEQGDVPSLGKPVELARLINTFAKTVSGFNGVDVAQITAEYARHLFHAAASKTFDLKPADPTAYYTPRQPGPISEANAKAVLASLLTMLSDLGLIRLPPDGDDPLVR
jgi:hypothetical protein